MMIWMDTMRSDDGGGDVEFTVTVKLQLVN